MRGNWQQCRYYPPGRATWVSLYASLNRKGSLAFNQKTFEKMGEPKAVLVYFDPTNNRFGLKPSPPESRNAFRICKSGVCGGRRIHVESVLKEFRIDIPETIQFFNIEFTDENILVLDLRTARVSNRVFRHQHNRKRLAATAIQNREQ